MADNSQKDDGALKRGAAAKAFRDFLARLTADPDEAGLVYERLRRKLIRYFAVREEAVPEEAADIVLERVADKLADGASVEDVLNYALGIARLVRKERLRQARREQAAWVGFAGQTVDSFDEAREEANRRMKNCLDKLTAKQQALLIAYYDTPNDISHDEVRANLARQNRLTLNQLRLRIFRLRQHLASCLKASERQ
jgi:DNA-directed RNA polymerase specialized sigma24 family protein